MSVLVTGANGYLGSKIVDRLFKEGKDVVCLVRSMPDKDIRDKARFVFGDITDESSVLRAIKGCSEVYHLAAKFKGSKASIEKINIEGTRLLLNAAFAQQVKVVITSSAGVIGPQTSENLVNEETIRTTPYFNHYESSKAEVENLSREFAKKGLLVIIVNPTRVFGPGKMTEGNIPTLIIEKYLESIWRFIPGNGQAIGNYAFVDDVVEGHLLAMKNGQPGERYILGGENVSFNDFYKTIGSLSGKKIKMFNISTEMLLNLAEVAENLGNWIDREPIVTPEWVKRYTYDWSVDCSRSQNELGLKLTPFKEGVQSTIDWIEQKRLQ